MHNNYSHHFLVAPRKNNGEKTIIYIFSHDQSGAKGLFLDLMTPFDVRDMFHELGKPAPTRYWSSSKVIMGGVTDMGKIIALHTRLGLDSHPLFENDEIAISMDSEVLSELNNDAPPMRVMFFSGYHQFASGEVEYLLAQEGWLPIAADVDLLLNTSSEMRYEAALHKIDINSAQWVIHHIEV